ncbi:hypothetical protein [Cryobacterium sp. PH29-G1]|uniref:hypothetical protein n=1 Tax=Cryobacterium sp. PH29-G1 TaxID=3046211 RepID=UPI0024B8D752|nr:hypothetical protein [Cryobacterium sp. PH29-G1]MDJ0348019.1 hypothetical protein [Cryobacterium sp. PH29-G1]
MARSNILDRFRPVGAPGAASPSGDAASDALGPAAELAPVFAALAADVEACRKLVEDARQSASDELSRAQERADAVIARARLDVGAEQARAAAAVLRTASEHDAQLLEQSSRKAAELEETGTAQLATAVHKVMDALVSEQLTLRR